MKKIFFILILMLLLGLSIEQEKHLSNKQINAIKCVFNTKERIEDLINIIESFFAPDSFSIFTLLKLAPIIKECFNYDITDLISKLIS